MAKQTEDAKLLAELENEMDDVNYDRVAEQEAHIGGRALPTGLDNEVAVVDNAVFSKDDKGVKQLRVSCKATTPEDYKGTSFTKFYSFGPSFTKKGEQFRSKADNVEIFVNDMKLMGFDATEYSGVTGLVEAALKTFTSPKKKIHVLYGTAKTTNDNGYPKFTNIMGLAEEGDRPSRPRKASKPEVPDFSVGDAVETTGDYFGDGVTYTGVIEELGAGEAVVKFDDDNSTDTVPFESLSTISKKDAPEEVEEEASPFDFGEDDMVLCKEDYFGDGQQYEGRVTAIKGDKVTVEFEDGEVVDMAPEDLEAA